MCLFVLQMHAMHHQISIGQIVDDYDINHLQPLKHNPHVHEFVIVKQGMALVWGQVLSEHNGMYMVAHRNGRSGKQGALFPMSVLYTLKK
jgi:hypothetical protein